MLLLIRRTHLRNRLVDTLVKQRECVRVLVSLGEVVVPSALDLQLERVLVETEPLQRREGD